MLRCPAYGGLFGLIRHIQRCPLQLVDGVLWHPYWLCPQCSSVLRCTLCITSTVSQTPPCYLILNVISPSISPANAPHRSVRPRLSTLCSSRSSPRCGRSFAGGLALTR